MSGSSHSGKSISRNYSYGVVRPVEIAIGEALIPYADKFIVPEVTKIAERCSSIWGFDIRPLRVYDDPEIDRFEYRVFIMGKLRGAGYLKEDMYLTRTHDDSLPEGCEYLLTSGMINKKYCWVPYIKKEIMQDKNHILICSFRLFSHSIMHILSRSKSMLYTPFTLIQSIKEIESNNGSSFFSIPDWMPCFAVLFRLNKMLIAADFSIKNVHEIFEIIINNAALINDEQALFEIAVKELKMDFTSNLH